MQTDYQIPKVYPILDASFIPATSRAEVAAQVCVFKNAEFLAHDLYLFAHGGFRLSQTHRTRGGSIGFSIVACRYSPVLPEKRVK